MGRRAEPTGPHSRAEEGQAGRPESCCVHLGRLKMAQRLQRRQSEKSTAAVEDMVGATRLKGVGQ